MYIYELCIIAKVKDKLSREIVLSKWLYIFKMMSLIVVKLNLFMKKLAAERKQSRIGISLNFQVCIFFSNPNTKLITIYMCTMIIKTQRLTKFYMEKRIFNFKINPRQHIQIVK